MEQDIFISYSRKDLKLVNSIKQQIEEVTVCKCWMDLNGIESGSILFTDDIVEAINNCKVFMFMLSEYSQTSEFALRELHFAYNKAKEGKMKVVIINISQCQMTDKFSFMYGLTDTIDWTNSPQRDKLFRDLKRWTECNADSKAKNIRTHDNKPSQAELHSYGTLLLRADGSKYVSNLIKKTDPLVIEKHLLAGTGRDKQTSVEMEIYQTDSIEDEVEVNECTLLVNREFPWGFPVPAGTPIDIILARASDGEINVSVVCKGRAMQYNIT